MVGDKFSHWGGGSTTCKKCVWKDFDWFHSQFEADHALISFLFLLLFFFIFFSMVFDGFEGVGWVVGGGKRGKGTSPIHSFIPFP